MTVGSIISKDKLISVFKKFKKNPNKVFVASDFNPPARKTEFFRRKYLNLLIFLGLIEEVNAFYKFSKFYKNKRVVKGYKLLFTQSLKNNKI